MKEGHRNVGGTGKNMWGLQVSFFNAIKNLKSRK